jgi:predicted ATPase/tRNA A-37 threonylcarbamoyl transferase component Bud32
MLPQLSTTIGGRRYILQGLIGEGGMGAVYRAVDRLTSYHIALKRMLTGPQELQLTASYDLNDFQLALAQEFKLLASLRHPNIIGVLDYGFDGANGGRQPYFTMELLENGRDLLAAAENHTLEQRVNLLIQTLRALSYLHRRGILHRDLKPANVLAVGPHDAPVVKVLDFGLSVLRDRTNEDEENTAGTIAYMAPEVLTGNAATEAADLYAVGVMAYELFAGEHPFRVGNPSALVIDIMNKPPDIERLDVPDALANVIDRLLQKDPQDRYASAGEAINALNAAINQPQVTETAATRESFLQAARLVGRDHEIHLLTHSLDAAAGIGRQGSAWLIAGESGVGKSRFLDEVRALALIRGALVMRGQAVSSGGFPYQLWQQVLQWLVLLNDLSPVQAGLLARVLVNTSILADVPAKDTSALDPQALQNALFTLLEDTLRAQKQPVVIILEDLHWCGSESMALLNRLNAIAGQLPLLLLASYRDDERPDLPNQLSNMRLMRLQRLDELQIAELSAAMLGEAGRQPQVVGMLQRETEGNVYFLVEVVRALAEEVGNLDEIGRQTLPANVFTGGVARIVQRRLAGVPPQHMPLLQAAAIFGRVIDVELIEALDEQIAVVDWLTACSNAAVLDVDDNQWRFAHDKLREGVLASLSDHDKRQLHRKVAQTLETLYGDAQTLALAHHWGQAGDIGKEEHYTTLAGQQALRNGAYRESAAYLNRALSLVTHAPTPHSAPARTAVKTTVEIIASVTKEAALKEQLAEAYVGFGQYTDAKHNYQQALDIYQKQNNVSASANIHNKLGDVAMAQADFERAKTLYTRARDIYTQANNDEGRARALQNLGNALYELGDDAAAKTLFQQSLDLARETGGRSGMAAGAVRGPLRDHESEEARTFLQKKLDSRRAANDQLGVADVLFDLGTLARQGHNLPQALHYFEESLKLARTLYPVTQVPLNMLLNQLAETHLHNKNAAAATPYLHEALRNTYAHQQEALLLYTLKNVAAALAVPQSAHAGDSLAVCVLAFVIHQPNSNEETQTQAEDVLADIETRMKPDALQAAWERGKGSDLAQVLAQLPIDYWGG